MQIFSKQALRLARDHQIGLLLSEHDTSPSLFQMAMLGDLCLIVFFSYGLFLVETHTSFWGRSYPLVLAVIILALLLLVFFVFVRIRFLNYRFRLRLSTWLLAGEAGFLVCKDATIEVVLWPQIARYSCIDMLFFKQLTVHLSDGRKVVITNIFNNFQTFTRLLAQKTVAIAK